MSDQFDKIGNEKDNIDTDGAPVLACCADTTATAASPLLTDTAGTATPVLPDTAGAAAPVPANHQGHHLQQQLIELMLHSLDFRIFSIELCLGTFFTFGSRSFLEEIRFYKAKGNRALPTNSQNPYFTLLYQIDSLFFALIDHSSFRPTVCN